MTLFDQDGAGLDAIYLRLRDTNDSRDAQQKAYLDGLWTRARRDSDQGTVSQCRRNRARHRVIRGGAELRLGHISA
jgi:hypothetical protein